MLVCQGSLFYECLTSSEAAPETVKQQHTITFPPPCLTVGSSFLVFGLKQTVSVAEQVCPERVLLKVFAYMFVNCHFAFWTVTDRGVPLWHTQLQELPAGDVTNL